MATTYPKPTSFVMPNFQLIVLAMMIEAGLSSCRLDHLTMEGEIDSQHFSFDNEHMFIATPSIIKETLAWQFQLQG